MSLEFEWDEDKAKTNLKKHRVSFEEASSVFGDPLALRGYLGSLSLHKIPKREGVTTNPNAGRPRPCGSRTVRT